MEGRSWWPTTWRASLPAFVPAFLLTRRLDPVAVIGGALAALASGRGTRPVASALEVPHDPLRGWRRRYRARAPTLVAGFAALAAGLGATATELSSEPERAGLEALAMAWTQARRRLGESVAEVFEFASLNAASEPLSTTTSPRAGLGGTALMSPVPLGPSLRSSS